jgi:hypothetical protein
MQFAEIPNSFDFELVAAAFEFPLEKMCFERLTSVVDHILDENLDCSRPWNESRDLCFLQFYSFIENKMRNVSYHDFKNGPQKDLRKCRKIKHNKYNRHSFYDAYIILKYMNLSEEKKNLLRDVFRLDTCDPFVMYKIRNNNFVQSFFSVTQELEYRDAILKFDLQNHQFIDEMIMLSWTVDGLIKKFQCIQMRFDYIYYVTQNIVFSKTNFEKDFVERFHFAKKICVERHNLYIFSPLLSCYHGTALQKDGVGSVLNDSGLPMAVRKLYYDSMSDCDKWTHTNFAKKMDSAYLDPYVSEYFNKSSNDKVIQYYVEKEFWTLKIYTEYLDLFEKIQLHCNKNQLWGQEYCKFIEFCDETIKRIPFRRDTLDEISNVFL